MALLLEYDFTNLSDGDPLPTEIGYGVLREDAGVFSVVDEANPAAYFKASKQPDETISKALFAYESSPGPGGATDQRGLICSPGILEGLNSDVSVEFANPMKFFSSGIDEFLLQMVVGSRGENKIVGWIGGMLLSQWTSGGGWSPEMELSVVQGDSSGITKLETQNIESVFHDLNALTVRVKGDEVIMRFNGVYQVVKTGNTFRGGDQAFLQLRATTTTSGVETAYPILTKFQGESLRSGRLGAIKEIPGNFFLPPITGDHFYRIPIQDLESEGKLVQIAPRQWRFLEETLVEVDGAIEIRASEGAVIVSYQHILDHAAYHWCKVRYL